MDEILTGVFIVLIFVEISFLYNWVKSILVYISKHLFNKYTFKSKLDIAVKRTHKKIAKDFRPKLEIQKEQQKL